jgi:hypothetical protein
VGGNPWLRQLPGSDTPIPLKAIMDALRRLDEDGGGLAARRRDRASATYP